MRSGVAVGASLLAALVVAAAFAPLLAPADPTQIDLAAILAPPSMSEPLGRDGLGRDVASRILHGARISLGVGVAAVAISLAIGTIVGLAAGFAGGWLDEIVTRVIDVLLAFPGILLAIAAAAILGPSVANTTIALSVVGWIGYARLVRAETLSLRERVHVEAARALGANPMRLATRHVLPMIAGPLVVQATFGLAGAIVAEASLSFLGLGAAPPTPSWGAMLAEGRAFFLVAPHLTLAPAAAVFVSVLGVHLLGEGLRARIAGERPLA